MQINHMMYSTAHSKGFTLVELLVVIAIVAVLSTVVIITLNPAELLKQTRDSNRISDMATLKSAVSLYLADATTPSLGSATLCYESTTLAPTSTGCGGLFAGTRTTTQGDSRTVDGTGWIPVNFNGISSGSPLGNLPIDPLNNETYFYAYAASGGVFEVNSNMESNRYVNGGSEDVESKDGGNKADNYEAGNAPSLAL